MSLVVVGFVGKASSDHRFMLGRELTNSFLYYLVKGATIPTKCYLVLILLFDIDMNTL